jgi:hypothetical protein
MRAKPFIYPEEDAMRTLQAVAIIFLAVLFLVPVGANGQNPVRVPDTGFINAFIMGDTLANGTRRDTNAVYVLTRGKTYVSNAVMINNGWTFRLKANDTTGNIPRPVVYLYVAGTGTYPGYFIQGKGNIVVQNVVLSGVFDPDPQLPKIQGNLFEFTASGFNLTLDSCVLANTSGQLIRTGSAAKNIKVTNCIFANMGYNGTSNLGAGKGIDVRNNSLDTLIFVNNTFVNWMDRIVRHYQSTANIKYFRFDHNTCVNGMSYHGFLSLGKLSGNVLITNNMLVDHFALGADSDAVRQGEFADSREFDQWGAPRMTWVIAVPDTANTIFYTIKNNYYRVTPALQSFFDSASILPIVANPPLTVGPALTHNICSRIGADSATAFQLTTADLQKTPKLMVEFMKWYRRPWTATDSGGNKQKVRTGWNASFDYDRKTMQYYTDTLNCSYSTSAGIYSAATGGYPVGDLNWFPARYTAWKNDPSTGVDAGARDIPELYSLEQNYPNPFNPSTQIVFGLPNSTRVTLEVYNLLGQKVATLLDEMREPGSYTVSFDGKGMSSGVYFYRLTAGNQVTSKKMMLVK